MNRNRLFTLFITLILIGSFVFPALSVIGQSQEAAKPSNDEASLKALTKAMRIVERYREGDEQSSKGRKQAAQKQERPQWVEQAFSRSIEQLQHRKGRYGIRDAEAEFRMMEAMKDGRGYMDVRLTQTHNGVEVFGGQLITHLDEQNALRAVSGRMFEEARINTTPKIDEAQAIEAAKAALQHEGEFAQEPTARLVILPHRIMKNDKKAKGAMLVYLVKLMVESGEKAGDHQFFISARDGSVVWKLNARNSAFGVGGSLYSGVVELNVDFNPDTGYTLRDPDRGHSEVFDTLDNSLTDFARPFGPKTPAAWGSQGDASNRETVAVDALFGLEKTWDYFFFNHGRWGTDNIGAGVEMFVHYVHPNDLGINGGNDRTNNAYGGQNRLYFGNGDGTQFGPLVSLDIVGHEYTHCLIDDTLFDDGFIYSGESGAIDESFADIFGTSIEFYAGSINGREPDYLIGEDAITPNTAGDALRDMQNPTNFNQPDHYSNRFTGADDNGGVHINSGIMNHVFYLLSEGGTHSRGTFVPAIGRETAADLFYLALTRGLSTSAQFSDVANAMLQIVDQYPGQYGESVRRAVERAWFAVGVLDAFTPDPLTVPDVTAGRAVFYNTIEGWTEVGKLDASGEYQTARIYLGGVATGWSHIADMGNQLFFYNARTGFAGVAYVDAEGSLHTTLTFTRKRSFPPGVRRPLTYWTHVTCSNGYLFFYDRRDGAAEIGEITPNGYKVWKSYSAGSLGKNWSHVASLQGKLMFYNTNTGVTVIGELKPTFVNFGTISDINLVQVGPTYAFGPGWTHIISAGSAEPSIANRRGVLFYCSGNGLYRIGDIDPVTGIYTDRVPTDGRWQYSFLQPGWEHIVRMGDGLLFYSDANDSAMVGYVLTPSESDTFAREPFQVLKSYLGTFYLEPFPILASTLHR